MSTRKVSDCQDEGFHSNCEIEYNAKLRPILDKVSFLSKHSERVSNMSDLSCMTPDKKKVQVKNLINWLKVGAELRKELAGLAIVFAERNSEIRKLEKDLISSLSLLQFLNVYMVLIDQKIVVKGAWLEFRGVVYSSIETYSEYMKCVSELKCRVSKLASVLQRLFLNFEALKVFDAGVVIPCENRAGIVGSIRSYMDTIVTDVKVSASELFLNQKDFVKGCAVAGEIRVLINEIERGYNKAIGNYSGIAFVFGASSLAEATSSGRYFLAGQNAQNLDLLVSCFSKASRKLEIPFLISYNREQIDDLLLGTSASYAFVCNEIVFVYDGSISVPSLVRFIGRNEIRMTVSQINAIGLGRTDKPPKWITVKASVSFVKTDNFCYTACPLMIGDRQCSKKVVRTGVTKWQCERCSREFEECDYRYLVQVAVQDHTGLTWVTALQESGEEILGISAKESYSLKYEEQDDVRFEEIIRNSRFNQFLLKLKIKEEMYGDEQKVKIAVVKVEKVDPSSESRYLLDII